MIAKALLSVLAIKMSCALTLLSHQAHAGDWQHNVAMSGFERVHLYAPESVSPIGDGRALLIILHGCLQDIDAFLGANLEAVAEDYGMVIALPDAANKAGFDCWAYWTGGIQRSAGDYANLIRLAQELRDDVNLEIDTNQIYIAGLSSGASFANTTACLAPDIFAGMGISAGPSIGTSAFGALQRCETASVQSRCRDYAGEYGDWLTTQIASFAHGDKDNTVSKCYNRQNADGMAALYDVSKQKGHQIIDRGQGTAREELWQRGRVSMLWLNDVEHAWSGGVGAQGDYISDESINYARYLAEYFEDNNLRARRNLAPEIVQLDTRVVANALRISGEAEDIDGRAVRVSGRLSGLIAPLSQVFQGDVGSDGRFELDITAPPDNVVFIQLHAFDERDAAGPTISTQQLIGPAPAETPPRILEALVEISDTCALFTAIVADANDDLRHVAIDIEGEVVDMSEEEGSRFVSERCDLPPDDLTAQLTAHDSNGDVAQQTLQFAIAPPIPCFEERSFNYYHKLAGRARSEGNFFAPSYFAVGSEMVLPWSTWGRTTLKSEDQRYWELGQCYP